VEELLAERGVLLTDETVRQWCRTFGQAYANTLRRRRPKPGDKWHLDADRHPGQLGAAAGR
jgi:putative transposase